VLVIVCRSSKRVYEGGRIFWWEYTGFCGELERLAFKIND
jgi:hypothetical protein